MSIKKKSTLALVATALAVMGFASSAMAATDGFMREVTGTTLIPENRELHFIGWTKFSGSLGSYECHVTAVVKVTGTTGATAHVSTFTVPDTTKCTGAGAYAGCKLKTHASTNLPWHVTATPTDFDVTGNTVIHHTYEKCNNGTKSATLIFSEITLKPLKTGTTTITGTNTTLGGTAESGTSTQHSQTSGTDQGNPIAGVEISGSGAGDTVDIFGIHHNEAIIVAGELELTAPERCTYYLSTN